ncbi:putative transcript [Fasciola gigantica]|uniref:Putative transcript n=1 Tax=Fasciola gigantica TaxID=46835 RepID=A0A504YUD0_FASGI|nr:putative transcript [Fasciola gigantica]
MAYIDINSPYPVKVEDLEKSMWTNACKEVITFTLAAPIHYLSGVNLLLDLLPLRLPVVSLNPLTKADQDKICVMRDSWALHVCSFVHQITGLIELLGATDPRSTNVLYRNILDLVHRVADLGAPCATALATACLDSLFSQCLDQMLDIGVALKAFDHGFSWSEPDSFQSVTDEFTRLSEGLPDSQLCAELVQSLIKHVGHVDRDMSTLPHALHPLLLLTQHDQGFRLVRDALESPIAQINGQHLFASLVQRVNDCFSTENPDCQTTLAVCLQLLQSMVVGRASLPLTFTPDEVTQSGLQGNFDQGERIVEESAATSCPSSAPVISIARFRHWHISGCKVRTFLGWSGVGDEGKPVLIRTLLLEMLTDDEPSLEYLRTGMKNLLALLSEEFDVSGCDPVSNQETISDCGQSSTADSIPPWPEPRSLERLFAERPYFVAISDTACSKVVSQRRLEIARRRYHCAADLLNPPTTCLVTTGSSDQLTCNLTEMAQTCCNGLSIRDELLKCGRKRDSGDSAIRHQKRRRGQTSIIETGRTSKKFVAPMRGRGFVLRSGPGSSVSAGAAGAQHGSGSSSTGVPGGRPDPFRSRPLNTSRPPSLHVDDFTKLVKDDNVMEEMPRQRPYRDGRGFRGGRGQRLPSNRGGVNVGGTGGSSTGSGIGVAGVNSQSGMLSGGPSLLPNLPLGLGVQPISSLNAAAAAAAAALLPSWSTDNRPM